MKYKFVLIFSLSAVVVLSAAAPAFARKNTVPDMSVFLDQQMTFLETSAVDKIPNPTAPVETKKESTFFLRRFWWRIRPKAIFSLPGLVKIQVIPELEMLWERPVPAGWTIYKQ